MFHDTVYHQQRHRDQKIQRIKRGLGTELSEREVRKIPGSVIQVKHHTEIAQENQQHPKNQPEDIESNASGSRDDMYQYKDAQRPCCGQKNEVDRQYGTNEDIRTLAKFVVCTGKEKQDKRVGKDRYGNPDVKTSGIEGKNHKRIQEKWRMRLVIEVDLIEKKISQCCSCKGNYR